MCLESFFLNLGSRRAAETQRMREAKLLAKLLYAQNNL